MESTVINCACGCGGLFSKFDTKGRLRRFINGHNKNGGRKSKPKPNCVICNSPTKRLNAKTCSRVCRDVLLAQISREPENRERARIRSLILGLQPPHYRGESHYNWKGGISPKNQVARSSKAYSAWRRAVLIAANFTCAICGIRGGKLSAHHIRSWKDYPELRFDVTNGQCLHLHCHMCLHGLNKGGKNAQRVREDEDRF